MPAKRATELIFYVGLVSRASRPQLQANPTLAAGDVQISKDGGAFANLTTLPAVTPASGRAVKVTVSSTEMTADNVVIAFVDAAGAEWDDLFINVQTAARQLDDLAYPNTSGRGMDVDASGGVEVGSFQAGAITAAAFAAGAIDAAAIANAAIDAATFAAGAIDATAIASGAIDAATFAAGAIDATSIAAGAITAAKFAAGAIDAAAIATDAIGAAEIAAAAANKIADHILRRTYANARVSADGDAVAFRSLLGAVGKLVNKWSISGSTLTIFQEDDLTSTAPGGTQAITATAGADPITALDP